MRRLLYILMCLTCSMLARAQSTYQYRYWFDDDEIHAVTTESGDRLKVDIELDGLQETLHSLHVQVTDEKGVVSSPQTLLFVKSHMPTSEPLKYWFDDNTAKTWSLDEGASYIDVSHLEDGLHMVHVQTTGNSPSTVQSSYFLKTPQVLGVEALTVVTSIDGKLVKQEEVPANGGLLHYDFDATGLSEGVHLLSTQVVTASGVASSAKSSYFLRVNTADEVSNMKCFYAIDGQNGYTQAGTFSAGTFHFDLDVAALSNGLHRLTYLLVTPGGTASAMRTAFFMKTPLGGNGISAYHYWLNTDYEGRKQVNLEKKTNPLNLMTLLPVESVPLRSSQFHFEWTDGKPMIYAQNDFHIRFYDAADRCVDQCKDFTDYSVSREVKDAELLVSGKPVEKDKPAENEIQWYHFPAQIGDSLSFKVDRACTVQVFAPSGKEVYNASGSEIVEWGGVHAWEDGEYYLALHDVTAQQGTNTKLEFFQLDKYAVLTHTPDEVGAATGYFHVSLFGNGYDKLKKAILRMGDSHITADECMITDISNAMLEFYIQTDDQPRGLYDLELYFDENGNEETLVVPNAIEIAEPIWGEIEVTMNSLHQVAKPYPVTISIKNTGNVEYQMIPMFVASTNPDGIHAMYAMDFLIDSKSDSLVFRVDSLLGTEQDAYVLPLLIPELASKATLNMNIGYVTEPHHLFDVYAWCFQPWSSGDNQVSGRRQIRRKVVVNNDMCNFDPCEYIERYVSEVQNCVCGITWGNISLIAGASAAIVNHGRIRAVNMLRDMGAGPLGADDEYYDDLYGPIPRMCRPEDIIDRIIERCDPTDGVITAIRRSLRDAARDASLNGCHPREPHHVDPCMPGDPNEMYGYETENGSTFIKKDLEDVYYRIEFENDPEIANAAAHHIVITDVLDKNYFALSSLTPTSVKFGKYQMALDGEKSFVKTLDMRPAIDAIAQIGFNFDETTGVAKWDLQSLDPMTMEPTNDAMQGILPVNNDGNGLGEVTFDIKLKPGLADGTEITNKADIVFDFEKPIVTPTWTNTIDAVAPTSTITSCEMKSDNKVTLEFEGNDERSGIWRYDLYVQQGNGSAWIKAAEGITENVYSYECAPGLNYGFCVVATDNAGNMEEKELQREASVATYTVGDANGDGVVNSLDMTLAIEKYLGKDPAINFEAADVNGDGVINSLDATLICEIYLTTVRAKAKSILKVRKRISNE